LISSTTTAATAGSAVVEVNIEGDDVVVREDAGSSWTMTESSL